ncbi:MAG: rRNA cytosine-C5-methylase [Alistipes sp.]|nr:rRNA cytosine-C5-methylase [Alistipes sp.]
MRPLPEPFCANMRTLLGDAEAERLFAALDGVSPTSVRYNPYKGEVAAEARAVPWCAEGRYLDVRPQFTLDTAFAAGAYYVQEAGSQFVDYIARQNGVGEGAVVLDMCAAPGGKTTLYSTLVGKSGLVLANEYVRNRAHVLADNVRKWGIGNVVVTNNEPAHIAAFEQWFDMVAVDAPCSGEGMFRKDDEARAEWSEEGVRMCAVRQTSILQEAWRTLKPNGLLIYSTCTFNDTEDEGVLAAFMEEHADELEAAEPVLVDDLWGIVKGQVGAFQTFRFMPHRAEAEGFFVAVARRGAHVGGRRAEPKARKKIMNEVPKEVVRELSRYVMHPEQMHFAEVGDTLYGYDAVRYRQVRMLAESLTVLYSGVAMGQIFKGKLKPDWALSQYVGLNREAVACCEVSEQDALDYLRKHEVAVGQFAEGLNLVLHRDRALGFVKRIGARCNNMYPNSLKIINL